MSAEAEQARNTELDAKPTSAPQPLFARSMTMFVVPPAITPANVQFVNVAFAANPASPPAVPTLSTRPANEQSAARMSIAFAASPPAGAFVAVKTEAFAVQLERMTEGTPSRVYGERKALPRNTAAPRRFEIEPVKLQFSIVAHPPR